MKRKTKKNFSLLKKGRKIGTFSTYERARQEARKVIRKNHPEWVLFTSGNNPAITSFGYSIAVG